jgi:hypothetical protein
MVKFVLHFTSLVRATKMADDDIGMEWFLGFKFYRGDLAPNEVGR